MMQRIFIAINLPEAIKDELENLAKEINGLFPEESRGVARWVQKDNLHLTLLFLGPVKEEEIPHIGQIAKEVARYQSPLSLKIKRVCYGPPNKIPPRLIWLALEKNTGLLKLADTLKREMAGAGLLRKIEERSFSPHITLARLRAWQWRRIEPEDRPEIERELAFSFEVKSVEVMESVLKRRGAEYSIIESILLKLGNQNKLDIRPEIDRD